MAPRSSRASAPGYRGLDLRDGCARGRRDDLAQRESRGSLRRAVPGVSTVERRHRSDFARTSEEFIMTKPIAGVTGAGSGIGAAIATALASRGYHVVVTDVDLDSAQKIANSLESAQALVLDVTDPVACDRLIGDVVKEHGRLDVWVSNAGISKMQ